MDQDNTLVAQATQGSRDAFDELVRRHQVRIFQFTRLQTRGHADAEDLVQETFVRAYRAIGRFRGDSTFGTWLHRIALNVIRSHMAGHGGRNQRHAAAMVAGAEESVDLVVSEEDLENDVIRRHTIDHALRQLPAELRLVVTLREVQGLEYQEIATLTGLPMGTVESRIFRGRRQLRPLLESLIRVRRR